MAIRLFNLRHVPDDEAEDVRQLLRDLNVDFYETGVGVWHTGVPAIWLNDDTREAEVRAALDQYQQQRARQAQEVYAELKAQGQARTSLDLMRENPAKFVLYLIAVIVILYISLAPFLDIS